jgi:hypothetical protein
VLVTVVPAKTAKGAAVPRSTIGPAQAVSAPRERTAKQELLSFIAMQF